MDCVKLGPGKLYKIYRIFNKNNVVIWSKKNNPIIEITKDDIFIYLGKRDKEGIIVTDKLHHLYNVLYKDIVGYIICFNEEVFKEIK